MTHYLTTFTCALSIAGSALAPVAALADDLPFAVAQASDTSLTCNQLAMETVKVANMVAAAARQPQATQAAPVNSAADNGVNAYNNAVQQVQLNNRLAVIQAQAAQAGVSSGTTNAAVGGALALAAAMKSGEGAQDAAVQTAADFASQQLAARIPGGALVGGLVSGLFSHKKKAAPVADTSASTQASNQLMQLGQQRMTFLQSLSVSKKCQ